MHYETPYVNYTIPGDFSQAVLDEGDVIFKDELSVKPLAPDIPLPSYAHPTDAGLDLHAISVEAPGTVIVATCIIQPGMTAKVHTGIAIKLPHGTFGAVYPRSGLATKTGLAPANMVGVIDENYTGEIIVALHNYSNEPQAFAIGDRIAQLVIQPVVHCIVTQVAELPDTDRGNGGFGSTGGNT
jgi:dUTP pyrophosphatase